jgi:hypothetical protein
VSKPNGDDEVVTSIERSPNVQCLDGQEFVVRLKEDADGYFGVQCEPAQKLRVLPDKAEHEIMRIRYLSMKDRAQRRRLENTAVVKNKKKIRTSSGKVMFTTLADVMREADEEMFPVGVTRQDGDAGVDRSIESTCVEADDELFLRVLREVNSFGGSR